MDKKESKKFEENNEVINNNPRSDENETPTTLNRNFEPGEEPEEKKKEQ